MGCGAQVEEKSPPPRVVAVEPLCAPAPSGWRPMQSARSIGVAAEDLVVGFRSEDEARFLVAPPKDVCGAAKECIATFRIVGYSSRGDRWREVKTIRLPYPDARHASMLGGSAFSVGHYVMSGAGDLREAKVGPRPDSLAPNNGPPIFASSTEEILSWGGGYDTDGPTFVPYSTGDAVSVRTGTWRSLAPSPLSPGEASPIAMDGDVLFVGWDGQTARYLPREDRWVKEGLFPVGRIGRLDVVAELAGGVRFAFGGMLPPLEDGDDTRRTDGALYDPTARKWRYVAAPSKDLFDDIARFGFAWWTDGRRFFAWGGYGAQHGVMHDTGAVYDAQTDAWSAMASPGPSARRNSRVVFTGCDAVVYGGMASWDPSTGVIDWRDDGMLYRP
jgi:hypothetical protein